MRLRLPILALLALGACMPTVLEAADSLEAARQDAPAANEAFQIDDEGRRHGSYVQYHADGTVAVRTSYREGELHGHYKSYDEKGHLQVQKTYRKGQLHGAWKEYHPNKRLKLSTNYREGVRHGTYHVRNPQGKTTLKTTYRAGNLHGKLLALKGRERVSQQVWINGIPADVDGVNPFPRDRNVMASEVKRLLRGDGSLSDDPLEADRELALRQLKAYRCISGVPYNDISIHPAYEGHAQAAARVCRDLGHITHFPKNPGWEDKRFDFAAVGTKSSNLAQGMIACESIRGYMDDSDARNIEKVGHRAWCLNPRMTQTGFGTVDKFSAMWSVSNNRQRLPDQEIVTCPPAGHAPGAWFGTHWTWSASLTKKYWDAPQRGAIQIEVVAVDETFLPVGAPLALNHQSVLTKSAGTPYMIVFRPVGISLDAGKRYRVTIEGLTTKGEARRLRYFVQFFDLAYVTPRIAPAGA